MLINLAFGAGWGAIACTPLIYFSPKTTLSTYAAMGLGAFLGPLLSYNAFLARNDQEHRPRIAFIGAAVAVTGMACLLSPAIHRLANLALDLNSCPRRLEVSTSSGCELPAAFKFHL